MIAQRKIVPYTVPAFREETMSPAPTPVAAMIRPGPTILSRLPKVEGTSVLASRSPVTSAIFTLPEIAIETCLGTLDTNRSPDTTDPKSCTRCLSGCMTRPCEGHAIQLLVWPDPQSTPDPRLLEVE